MVLDLDEQVDKTFTSVLEKLQNCQDLARMRSFYLSRRVALKAWKAFSAKNGIASLRLHFGGIWGYKRLLTIMNMSSLFPVREG